MQSKFSLGVPMSLRRVGGIAAIAAATLITISCGQVYRPVVIPINITPPNSQNFHAVFAINTNIQANPGTAMQIDVSGDSDIGQENMGISPTHMAILPNDSRVFVASAGSLFAGESDVITAFAPAADSRVATGLGPPTIFTYPNTSSGPSATITAISESGSAVTVTLSPPGLTGANVGALLAIASVSIGGYNGTFPISQVISPTSIEYQAPTGLGPLTGTFVGTASLPVTCSYLPDYVATTQNNAVFVANYGVENGTNCNVASTDSVAMLSPTTNAITNIQYLPGGSHPIAMVETLDGLNLYVLNQGNNTGNNTVTDLSPIDLSTLATIPVPSSPLWAVARSDSHRVYVLTQAGTILPIDPATNTILPSATTLSVGAGANLILYDTSLNRLYVTNPGTSNPSDAAVYIFGTTGGTDLSGNPNDTPSLLKVIPMGPGSALCPGSSGCSPVSVAPLPDGTRFYVASYENETACSDPNVGTSVPCIVPMLTVFDALSMTAKTSSSTLLSPSTSLSLLTSPLFSATQYGVPPVASCVPAATYTPGTTRFRMFTTASADSSHVYVSICDAGTVADVATNTTTIATGTNTPDTLITDLLAPFGNCTSGTCGSQAAITSFSIASNVVTFQAANNFIPGQQVEISGLGVGTYLNRQLLTVLPTGLSGSQFECSFTYADVPTTSDSGIAVTLPVAAITSFQINSGVVTFTGVNTFIPGTRVTISNLTSSAGAPLNGQILTVLATGLIPPGSTHTQFECNVSAPDVKLTPDSGKAVPQSPPQSPIFLLTGQ